MIAPLLDRGDFAPRDENCSELGFREGEEKRAGRERDRNTALGFRKRGSFVGGVDLEVLESLEGDANCRTHIEPQIKLRGRLSVPSGSACGGATLRASLYGAFRLAGRQVR